MPTYDLAFALGVSFIAESLREVAFRTGSFYKKSRKAKPRVIVGRKATDPDSGHANRIAGLPQEAVERTGFAVAFERLPVFLLLPGCKFVE